ncbi:MAG: putative toxin-antitoxin system toxin component, PIN family [archaeon]
MKIVLDTNVLLSATFWYGDSFRLLKIIEEKKHEFFLSKDILDEFSRVLEYKEIKDKIKNKNLEIRNSFQKIVELATIIEPTENVNIITDDPSDNIFLECAKAAHADCIISQDQHLLKLVTFGNCKILTPHDFLKTI